MLDKFSQLCCMSQKDLKKYVALELAKTHTDVRKENGFVFAKGTFPVLLVAHLDTVHNELPNIITFDPQTQALSSSNGIGGDDRCGVYMILEIIKKYNCSVLFCEDEEIGGKGAEKFTKTKLSKNLSFNYIIEFDRKGSNDAVFYDCDNPDFTKFITKEFYETAYGTFSDISVIAPYLGCAAVNLSCGYYKAHTKDEYVVFSEMEDSIDAACKILERTTEEDKFDYIEDEFSFKFEPYLYGDEFYDDHSKYFLMQYVNQRGMEDWFEVDAVSTEEAIGIFCINHPNLSFNNIIDIQCDEDM